MSWERGFQEIPIPEKHFNQYLTEEYEGKELELEEAKALFYEFLKNNPTFAADLLLGVSLFPYQHLMINAMMKRDAFYGIISRGGSKCQKFDSQVITDLGVQKIGDVKVGQHIQAKDKMCLVEGKTVNPKEKTFRVTTNRRFESEGLDYHRVLTLNENLEEEWRFAKDLKVGDVMVMRKNYPFPEQADIFKDIIQTTGPQNKRKIANIKGAPLEEWYRFFGILIGDGHMNQRTVTVTNQDQSIIDFLKNFGLKIGLSAKVYDLKESNCKSIVFYSVSLISVLQNLGFNITEKAKDKIIPYKLLQASKENLGALLKGLFSTDGYCCVEDNPKRNSKRVRVGFTSCSIELIRQVRMLLLNFDIVSSTGVTFKGGLSSFPNGKQYKCNKAWSIILGGQNNLQNFQQHIGFCVDYKRENLALVDKYKYQNGEFSEYIPLIGPYLEKKYNKKSHPYNGKVINFRSQTSIFLLNKLLESTLLDDEDRIKLQNLNNPDLFFDAVKTIEEDEAVTVDLQVNTEECYVSDGFINHNSWTTAIFAALYAFFNQGIRIGIISSTFRASRQLFKTIEDLMDKPEGELMQQCLVGRPSHQQDSWEMKIGDSYITSVPLGSGERLRGFRFQCLIIDELLLIPEKIYNEVLMPFLSVKGQVDERRRINDIEDRLIKAGKLEPEKRTRFQNNKIIGLSSASYEFEFLAKLYRATDESIFEQPEHRARRLAKEEATKGSVGQSKAIFQFNYEMIPEALYDFDLIQSAKESMSSAQFAREFGALFTKDSGGFYSMKHLKEASYEMGQLPFTEIKGDPTGKYVMGLDSSWSKAEEADDFSIQILKIDTSDKHRPTAVLVHTFALPSQKQTTYMDYVHYLYTNFNIVAIFADYFGGVTFFEAINEYAPFKNSGIEFKYIEGNLHYNLNDERSNEEFKLAKKSYNKEHHKVVYFLKTTADWARISNEQMQGDIEHKRLMFASDASKSDREFERQCKIPLPMERITFIRDTELLKEYETLKNKSSKQQDFVEHVFEMVEDTKEQIALIEISMTPQGQSHFDLPQKLKREKGANKTRKDSYSSLLFGNWGVHCYHRMETQTADQSFIGFVPHFIK